MQPLLKAVNLTRAYPSLCPKCIELTEPEHGTNVCSACGSVVACAQVSFELYDGEVLGIIGESGSGKSTVLKILNFELEPQEGELYLLSDKVLSSMPELGGKNLLKLSPYQKRVLRNRFFGIVYQNPQLGLNMDVSAGGNVAEKHFMAGFKNFWGARKLASELLSQMEFPTGRMDESPRNFSGGMQQRVQIARALANNPVVLLLDEITTGLDVSVQASLLDLLKRLITQNKMSALLVSHDFKVISFLAERTIVMRYGRIVEKGLTDQILQDPQDTYTQLLVRSIL